MLNYCSSCNLKINTCDLILFFVSNSLAFNKAMRNIFIIILMMIFHVSKGALVIKWLLFFEVYLMIENSFRNTNTQKWNAVPQTKHALIRFVMWKLTAEIIRHRIMDVEVYPETCIKHMSLLIIRFCANYPDNSCAWTKRRKTIAFSKSPNA